MMAATATATATASASATIPDPIEDFHVSGLSSPGLDLNLLDEPFGITGGGLAAAPPVFDTNAFVAEAVKTTVCGINLEEHWGSMLSLIVPKYKAGLFVVLGQRLNVFSTIHTKLKENHGNYALTVVHRTVSDWYMFAEDVKDFLRNTQLLTVVLRRLVHPQAIGRTIDFRENGYKTVAEDIGCTEPPTRRRSNSRRRSKRRSPSSFHLRQTSALLAPATTATSMDEDMDTMNQERVRNERKSSRQRQDAQHSSSTTKSISGLSSLQNIGCEIVDSICQTLFQTYIQAVVQSYSSGGQKQLDKVAVAHINAAANAVAATTTNVAAITMADDDAPVKKRAKRKSSDTPWNIFINWQNTLAKYLKTASDSMDISLPWNALVPFDRVVKILEENLAKILAQKKSKGRLVTDKKTGETMKLNPTVSPKIFAIETLLRHLRKETQLEEFRNQFEQHKRSLRNLIQVLSAWMQIPQGGTVRSTDYNSIEYDLDSIEEWKSCDTKGIVGFIWMFLSNEKDDMKKLLYQEALKQLSSGTGAVAAATTTETRATKNLQSLVQSSDDGDGDGDDGDSYESIGRKVLTDNVPVVASSVIGSGRKKQPPQSHRGKGAKKKPFLTQQSKLSNVTTSRASSPASSPQQQQRARKSIRQKQKNDAFSPSSPSSPED